MINTEAVRPTQQAFFDGSGGDDETTSPFYDQFQDVMVNLEDTGAFENINFRSVFEWFSSSFLVYEANFPGLLKEIQEDNLWGEDLKTTAWLTESSGWMTTTEPTTVQSTTQELITGIVKECDDQDLCDYEGSAESDMVKSEFSHQKKQHYFSHHDWFHHHKNARSNFATDYIS